jgi:hypothetical protein
VPSSQQPLHNKAKNTSLNRKTSGKKQRAQLVIKAIAVYFILLKTVPRLSNTYRTRYAVMTPTCWLMIILSFNKGADNLIVHLFWFRETNGFSD